MRLIDCKKKQKVFQKQNKKGSFCGLSKKKTHTLCFVKCIVGNCTSLTHTNTHRQTPHIHTHTWHIQTQQNTHTNTHQNSTHTNTHTKKSTKLLNIVMFNTIPMFLILCIIITTNLILHILSLFL